MNNNLLLTSEEIKQVLIKMMGDFSQPITWEFFGSEIAKAQLQKCQKYSESLRQNLKVDIIKGDFDKEPLE